MPTLQVREVPMHVYGQLQERASKERRSLAQETLVAIERGLGMTGDARERRRALLRRIRERPAIPDAAGLPDPVGLLREDRAR
jgi:NAD(P)H-hydrate repair Nnr-like enzyme with NAD(P)H-hydrate dehydratase domain